MRRIVHPNASPARRGGDGLITSHQRRLRVETRVWICQMRSIRTQTFILNDRPDPARMQTLSR